MWWLEIAARAINIVLMISASVYDVKYKKIPVIILAIDIAVGIAMTFFLYKGLVQETVIKIMPGVIILAIWIIGLRIIGPADGLIIIGMGLIMTKEEYIISMVIGLFLLWFKSIWLIFKGVEKDTTIAFAPILTIGIIMGEILWII